MRKPLSLVLLILLAAPWLAGAQLAGTRPNIVLVMTDDQGFPPVGANGHPWLQTPHLDKLAARSTRFTRFLVSPTCSPTRSAIMTGRHEFKNGVTHTILERERMTLQASTLPEALRAAGYTAGIFGKWHLGDEAEYQPEKRGFEEVFIHGAGGIGQSYDCSCADAPKNSYYSPVIRHNGTFVKTDGYCTDVFFTAALGWIKQRKESKEPFFAYITPNAPHGPYHAPEKNAKRFLDLGFKPDTAGFYGMVENIDENMGRLMTKLMEWKLLENTVVIFMSDNGMTGGGSGRGVLGTSADGKPMEFYNAGMRGLKGSPDEGGVRVPFYISWEGKLAAGKEIDRIAAHIDLFPTFAALAGADLPENQVEGRSLLPLLEGTGGEWADRYLFTHFGRWKTGENPDDSMWKTCSVRNQRFRWVNGTELFDMEADPGQTKNVMDQHPDVVAGMRAAYEAFWKEARPLMVNEDAPMSPTRPYFEWYAQQEANGGIPAWKAPEL